MRRGPPRSRGGPLGSDHRTGGRKRASGRGGGHLVLEHRLDLVPEFRAVGVTVYRDGVLGGGPDDLVLLAGDGQRAPALAGHLPAVRDFPPCRTSHGASLPGSALPPTLVVPTIWRGDTPTPGV